MNAQLNTKALAVAGGATFAVVQILCLLVGALSSKPDPWLPLFLGAGPTVGGWIIFVVEGAVIGVLIGWLVALFYNKLARTEQRA